MGKWINADPIGLKGGINLLCYSNNQPIILIDNVGLEPTPFQLRSAHIRKWGAIREDAKYRMQGYEDLRSHFLELFKDAKSLYWETEDPEYLLAAQSHRAEAEKYEKKFAFQKSRRDRAIAQVNLAKAEIRAEFEKEYKPPSRWDYAKEAIKESASEFSSSGHGKVLLGIGLISVGGVLLSGSAGLVTGSTAFSGGASVTSGAVLVGVGTAQSATKTSPQQDRWITKSVENALSLKNPPEMAGGVLGVAVTQNEEGLRTGTSIGKTFNDSSGIATLQGKALQELNDYETADAIIGITTGLLDQLKK